MNSTSNNLFWLSYSSTHINELSSPFPQKTTTATTHTHTEQRKKPKKHVNEDTKDSFSDPLFLLLMPVLMNSTPDCPFLSFWQITFLIVCKWSTHQRLLFWLLTNYPFIHVHFHVKKHHQKKKTKHHPCFRDHFLLILGVGLSSGAVLYSSTAPHSPD